MARLTIVRVLWLAPWGRPLAAVFAEGLRAHGAEVLTITTPQHYEVAAATEGVVVVTGSVKRPASFGPAISALGVARRFRPDVVVTEAFTDPRLLPILRLAPVGVLMHDDSPHDHTELKSWHHRVVADHVLQRADLIVTFSDFVARHARVRWSIPAITVPLPSEAPESLVQPVVAARDRRNMVVLGRINPYKDLPTTLAAWAIHARGPGYRGDELVIIGDGNEAALDLPSHCRWRRQRFQFADVLPVLAHAKTSVVHYRSATQSGVQVTSMQCGTAAIVSDVGGLPEYLPAGDHPVPAGDPALLAAAFDEFADPAYAAAKGIAARAHYESRFTAASAAELLLAQLRDELSPR